MKEDRRHIAIMFTDIAGYTALMATDEDKAFEMLRKNLIIHKSCIEKHRGTLIKEMGDGLLISFNLASDAVNCAIDIQNDCKKKGIPLKIGIHEGEMVYAGSDVLGDGVNIASRLQQDADQGCVFISGVVYNDIKNRSAYKTEFIGEKSMKGLPEPVKIYNVVSENPIDVLDQLGSSNHSSPEKKSIIVLPFVDISPDQDNEYFSDGLTEEIITDLSFIHDLLVISRNSAMTFKGTRKKTKEIAREVNVRYVLEGSVRKAGNNLRIVAQLIDASTDTHLWAEKYSGTLDDVFDIQEKVSRSIADSLKLKLNTEEDQKIAEHKVDNIQVYECYLRAKQDYWKYTEESLDRAEHNLINGLKILGEHELLLSGLGYVYFIFYDSGIRQEEKYLDQLKECIKRILQSDPDSGNGYLLSGFLKLKKENALTAYRDFKHAYELDPNNTEIIAWLGYILSLHLGRISEARPLVKKLLKIDPLTPINYGFIGWYYWMQGNFDKALKNYKKWYEMEPDSVVAGWYVAMLKSWNHDFIGSYNLIDHLWHKYPGNFLCKFLQLFKFCLQKNKEKAFPLFADEEIKKLCWNDWCLPWMITDLYAVIEEHDEALKWLERSMEWGIINYPLLSEIDPFLENIRSDSRFKKLMKKVKYEWENFEV